MRTQNGRGELLPLHFSSNSSSMIPTCAEYMGDYVSAWGYDVEISLSIAYLFVFEQDAT